MDARTNHRRLRLAVLAVWACAVVLSLGALVLVATLARGGVPLALDGADPDVGLVEVGLVDEATPAAGRAPVLADVPLGNRLLFAVGPLVTAASWVVTAALVAGVLREIGAGRPFGARALRRLPRAALVLGAGALVTLAADVVATFALLAAPGVVDDYERLATTGFDFPVTTLVCAVLVGALAVAFRQGAALERDLVGLV